MSKGKINVAVENIFPLIKKFLYSDHEIFLRELISNATDATNKLKHLSSLGEVKGNLGDTFSNIFHRALPQDIRPPHWPDQLFLMPKPRCWRRTQDP